MMNDSTQPDLARNTRGIGAAGASPLRATGKDGPCLARIVAAEAGASWEYRIPEGLSCDEGAFKTHSHPLLSWHGPDVHGRIWHEWRTSDEDLAILNADPMRDWLGMQFIQGIHYRVIIEPSEVGLDLRFTATNLTGDTLHHVNAFPCLAAKSESFHDGAMERTFIVTEAGLTAVKDTDRGTGDPVRTHYVVAGQRAKRFVGVPFWGEASATAACEGAILRTDAAGRFTVGTAWENVCELYHNEDTHHCIHSVALLGELGPAETKTVRGRIVLVEGGAEAALELLKL